VWQLLLGSLGIGGDGFFELNVVEQVFLHQNRDQGQLPVVRGLGVDDEVIGPGRGKEAFHKKGACILSDEQAGTKEAGDEALYFLYFLYF